MRKILLTVLTVTSLLAFNACKKDGAVGPAGPAGANGTTGAAGPAGTVGAAGAKGADGTKIIGGTVSPIVTDPAGSVVGDFYFDKSTSTLWGPKTSAGWAGTGTVLVGAAGAKGDTGTNGINGTKFLSGSGMPTGAIGTTGDFYFDTASSTFYGPKLADGTWSSTIIPLGSAYGAKVFTVSKGFETVTQDSKTFSESATVSYNTFNIITTFALNADDLVRINNYPGWSENREMLVAADTRSGSTGPADTDTYTRVVTFDNLTSDTPSDGKGGKILPNTRFVYSNNSVGTLAVTTNTFVLTATDITRLTSMGSTSFGFLTYAKATTANVDATIGYNPANPNELTIGKNLNFAKAKAVDVTKATTGDAYNAQYKATTTVDLNAIVGAATLAKYKEEGKVFVRFRYFTPNSDTPTITNKTVVFGTDAGWQSINDFANNYVTGDTNTFGAINSAINPFSVSPAVTVANSIFSSVAFGDSGTITVGPNQTANTSAATVSANGKVSVKWTILSGTNFANVAETSSFGPTTISSASTTTGIRGAAIARTTDVDFYSNGNGLTVTPAANATLNVVSFVKRAGGKPASYFEATKLVQVQILAIPASVVASAKAKGVDVNNAEALSRFIKL